MDSQENVCVSVVSLTHQRCLGLAYKKGNRGRLDIGGEAQRAAPFGNTVPGFCVYPTSRVAVFVNWWKLWLFVALPSARGRGGGRQVAISIFGQIIS